MKGARLSGRQARGGWYEDPSSPRLRRTEVVNWELKTENCQMTGGVWRSSWRALLVGTGCGGVLGLLPGSDDWYQGSLAEARQPFAMIRSPFGAGVLRSGVAEDGV